MKRVLYVIAVFFFFGLLQVNAEEKVKVYLFEAGGCPYCEAEYEYLEELQKTNSHFEIVKKELYVDHIEWQPGSDYDLGVKVAKAFNDAGYEEATYQATPFIVISDIYGKASYTTDLESVIEQAYEEGDNDVVKCFENGDDCEVRKFLTETDKKIQSVEEKSDRRFVLLCVLVGGLVLYSIYLTKRIADLNNNIKKTKVVKEEKENTEKKTKKKKK